MKLPLPVEITRVRCEAKRTRIAIVDLLLPQIGLSIRHATVHRYNNRAPAKPTYWISMPSASFEDEKGQRQTFTGVFFTRHLHEQLRDEVFRQLKETHPALFSDAREQSEAAA